MAIHSITRRTVLRGAAAASVLGTAPALAQNAGNWPDHPLRLIFGEIKKDAREGGLTDAEIDAELSRHRAARRH